MGKGRWETSDLVFTGGVEVGRQVGGLEEVEDGVEDRLKVTCFGLAPSSALPQALALLDLSRPIL